MNLIAEFEKVRDIPYRIPLSLEESDDCCTGKAKRLFNILKNNGYDVRYRLCTTKWNDLNLPKKIQEIPHDDNSSHTYLEIKIDGEWKTIDSTWDRGLKKVFKINEWDGKSDTTIAFSPIKYLSPKESSGHLKRISTPEAIGRDLKKNKKFYQAINKWFEEQRR